MPQNLSQSSQLGQITPFTPSLSHAFRLTDDIDRRHAATIARSCGGAVDHILEAGYGLATISFIRSLVTPPDFLRKGTPILPCRDAAGRVVAFHDAQLRWITEPSPHVANAIRARWSAIRILDTTSAADSVALQMNVCAIGVNGCRKQVVNALIAALSCEGRLAA
jgi:hypothetical protein